MNYADKESCVNIKTTRLCLSLGRNKKSQKKDCTKYFCSQPTPLMWLTFHSLGAYFYLDDGNIEVLSVLSHGRIKKQDSISSRKS